jgi:hypothetical protein
MSKRVADVLVETLQAADVKTCFGIVGDTARRCGGVRPAKTRGPADPGSRQIAPWRSGIAAGSKERT